jgi:ATP-dependent Clp protease ATP-binding subunit ClpA
MFVGFDEDSWRALASAEAEARASGGLGVRSEHLLLGLLESPGPVADLLQRLGLTRETVGRSIGADDALRAPSRPAANGAHGPMLYSAAAKQVLEAALRHSMRLKDTGIRPEHVFMALVDCGFGAAWRTFVDVAIDPDELRDHLVRRLKR